jgi:hypothetical protein
MRTIRYAAAAACAALALGAGPVHAQSKKELVNRILLLQQPGVEAMARSIAEQPLMPLLQAARQSVAAMPAEKREGVAKAVDAELKKYADDAVPLLRDRAIKLSPSVLGAQLETNFNEEELKQLINWLESPVIKRFNQLAPTMQRALAEKLVGETRSVMEPKLRAVETNVARLAEIQLPPAGSAPGGPGGAGAAGGAGSGSGAPMPGNRGAPK